MSSRVGRSQIASDSYPTPVSVVEALMSKVEFRKDDIFLEPCRGKEKRIIDRVPLPENQKLWAEIADDVDYLNTSFRNVDVIITNPPFSIAQEFLEKAFSELKADGTLIFLQRINFLGSIKRVNFWNRYGLPQKQCVLVPRPKFALKGSDSCEYAWFVYDRGNRTNAIPNSISLMITDPNKVKNIKKTRSKSITS